MCLKTLLLILSIYTLPALAEPSNDLIYKLKASVVKVHSFTKSGGHGMGSGVVVGKDLIATNCHVLANNTSASISKYGESYAPVALKADWKHDLCILKFEYLDMPAVDLGNSEDLKYEQEIFYIGFPGGVAKPQTTSGRIKALYPLDNSEVVRTDAAFIMGASGSPVFDADGKLVAISTFKSPGRGAYFYNMPVKWLKALLDAPEVTSMNSNEAPFWDAPEENMPFFMRVVLPHQNANWADLQKIAQAWISAEPENAEALFYAAEAEDGLGNSVKASHYYRQVLQLRPQHPAALIALGVMANRSGNQAEVEHTHVALKAIDVALDEEFTEALKPAQ